MSQNNASNEWETAPKKEEMVQLTNGKLWLSVQGPLREKGKPIIVCIPGLGDPGRHWDPVVNRLSPHVRLMRYERAGLGRSETSSVPRTAGNIAAELKELLETAPIAPPYVLLGQSYGGIISRELLAILPKNQIVGIVSVDSPQENTKARYNIPDERNPISEQIDYCDAVGITKEHKLTEEEAKMFLEDDETEAEKETGKQEYSHIRESEAALKEKKQFETQPLSPHPITVLHANTARDHFRMVEWARERGIGTAEQQDKLLNVATRIQENSGDLQKELTKLSSNSRYVFLEHVGHNVQIWDPQIMVDETLDLLKRLVPTQT